MNWRIGLQAILAIALTFSAQAADWPMFRGPDRNGISPEAKAPLTWSADKNIKWKAPLPSSGNSSPVVTGDRVFVSCAENSKGTLRSLYCFNRADGKRLWVKTVPYEKTDPTHAQSLYCASTPAADGQRVIVWHGSAGVFCYDYDGKQLWSIDLGTIRHIWGYASSPVLYKDSVILNCGPGARTFVAAIDRKSGTVLWKTEEPGGVEDKSPASGSWLGSWSTPLIVKINGQDQILVSMPGHVNAYDPENGKILWTCSGAGDLSYTDPLVASDVCVYMSGYGGAAIGFKMGGSGDIAATNRLWRVTDKNPQRIGSGVVIGNYIYQPSEPGIQCIEIATGKILWTQRSARQSFWASITAVGDRLYAISQSGTTIIFSPNPEKFTLLQSNELGEATNSTIAVSNGQLFIRTAGHLWCVEDN